MFINVYCCKGGQPLEISPWHLVLLYAGSSDMSLHSYVSCLLAV